MSVRNKLVALAAMIILVPLLIVGIVKYFVVKVELDEIGRLGIQNGTYSMLDLIDELEE